MTTATRQPAATQATPKTDPYIRQQDICTPWGLHYNAYQDAYQDTYRTPHAHPKTHRTPRKQTTAG